jgi:hypothetical protein
MSKVKADRPTIDTLISDSDTLHSELVDAGNAYDAFVSSAEDESGTFMNILEDVCKTHYNNYRSGFTQEELDAGQAMSYNEWKNSNESTYKGKIQELIDEYNRIAKHMYNSNHSKVTERASVINKAWTDVQTAINHFEESAVSLSDALEKVEGEKAGEIGTDKISVEGVGDVEAFVIDVDGDKIPIAEALNAFYTYQGETSATAVDMASAGKTEKELQEALDNIADNHKKLLKAGAFGMASSKDLENFYKNNLEGKDGLPKYDGTKSLAELLADPSGYRDYLNKGTGGFTDADDSRAVWMALTGGVLGGFLKNGDASPDPEKPEDTEKDKEKSWTDGTSPGGSGPGGSSNGGSNNGGGGKFKTPDTEVDKGKSDKGEKGDDKTPDLTDLTKDKLPSPLTEIKKDYDALAREKFDEQFKTEEEYAEYVMKVNEEFESLTPEQLSGKLKEYGYDESEIQYLLQPENKDVAATAYASGKLNADLTTRANELAKADNVKDFDTKYDDPIDRQNDNESDTSSYAYLRDGDLNANVSPVNYNKDVKAAKETWTKSQETYTTAATKANTAIEKANSQAAELEKLQKQYGKDTSKWKEAEIKKYNETVEKYNKAVTEAISANKEATTAKASMDKAQEAYTKQYNDYQDKIKKEARDAYAQGRQNNNNNGNPSDGSDAGNVTDTTPTGEVDTPTINPDGSFTI